MSRRAPPLTPRWPGSRDCPDLPPLPPAAPPAPAETAAAPAETAAAPAQTSPETSPETSPAASPEASPEASPAASPEASPPASPLRSFRSASEQVPRLAPPAAEDRGGSCPPLGDGGPPFAGAGGGEGAPAEPAPLPPWEDYFELPPVAGDCGPVVPFVFVAARAGTFRLRGGLEPAEVAAAAGVPARLVAQVAAEAPLAEARRAEFVWEFAAEGGGAVEVYRQALAVGRVERLAAVSCDYAELDVRRSLWADVAAELPELVLHLGDNIYGDHEFWRGVALLKSRRFRGGRRAATAAALIRAEYAENYVRSWRRWAFALRHARHLMIPDDHDVTNDFNAERFAPGSREGRVAAAALAALADFQLALRADAASPGDPAFRWLAPGALLCLCPRVGTAGLSVTAALIERLEAAAAPAERLVLAFGAAPLPAARGFYGGLYRRVYGTDGLWEDEEALGVYALLRRWSAAGGERRALLLGGDVHVGARAEVAWPAGPDGPAGRAAVAVTGPISNQPTAAEVLYAAGLRTPVELEEFRVEPAEARALRNFARVSLEGGGLAAELRWARARYPRRPAALPRAFLHMTNRANGVSGR